MECSTFQTGSNKYSKTQLKLSRQERFRREDIVSFPFFFRSPIKANLPQKKPHEKLRK